MTVADRNIDYFTQQLRDTIRQLEEFTGNRELVLQANNPEALVKMIKWASTAASMVSAPASRPIDQPDSATNEPSASNAPLVLDMNNIPDSSDINVDDVW